jgi:hypothetical protein
MYPKKYAAVKRKEAEEDWTTGDRSRSSIRVPYPPGDHLGN